MKIINNKTVDLGVGRRGDMMAKHHAWVNKRLPGYTGFGDHKTAQIL